MPNVEKAVERAARRYGLDVATYKRQMMQESGNDPTAVSPKGASGVAQIMPATAKAWGVNLNDGLISDDLDASAKNMRRMIDKYGSWEKALRGYNAGEGAIDASRGYGETNDYVRRILPNGEPPKHAKRSRGKRAKARTTDTVLPGRPGLAATKGTPATPGTAPIIDHKARGDAALQFLKTQDVTELASKISDIGMAELGTATNATPGTPALPGTKGVKELRVPGTSAPTQERTAGGARRTSRDRSIQIQPGADRAGVQTQQVVKDFLKDVSGRTDVPVDVGTGTAHSRMTASGNVSDHWDGRGADLLIGGDYRQAGKGAESRGDRIAAHAIAEATGKSFNQSLALARRGGIHNFQTKRGRIQIIWKADGHHDHVHIGIASRGR